MRPDLVLHEILDGFFTVAYVTPAMIVMAIAMLAYFKAMTWI
ncbi:MAG TPA: hypothetical protein VFV34_27605 [Blastocatellia bacterium]|nr:hypothetical protein [Blastocatellia bacterium]